MKNKLIRYVLIFFLSVGILMSALLVYVYLKRDEMKQAVLHQINLSLKTRIEVEEIGISVLQHFPQVGLSFNNVFVHDAFASKTPLLRAKSVHIGFNLMDIIRKRYRISKLSFSNGSVNLIRNKQGKGNYAIFPTSDTTAAEPILFQLKGVKLDSMYLKFVNDESKQVYEVAVNDANWTLDIGGERWLFDTRTNARVIQLRIANTNWIKEKSLNAKAIFSYLPQSEKWNIEPSDFSLQDLAFSAQGFYQSGKLKDDISLTVSSSSFGVPSLISLLPGVTLSAKDYKTDGNATLSGIIKGPISTKQTPDVQVQFSIKDGSIKRTKDNTEIHSINCSGKLYNQATKFHLTLQQLELKMKNSFVSASMELRNLINPHLSAKGIAKIDATDLIAWIPDAPLKSAIGNLDAQFQISGLLDDLTNKRRIRNANVSGSVSFNLKDMQVDGMPTCIQSFIGDVVLTNDLSFSGVKMKTQSSSVELSGKIINGAAYLFADAPATADLNVQADYINLNEWLYTNDTATSVNSASSSSLSWVINAAINKLVYDNIQLHELSTQVELSPSSAIVKRFDSKAFGGSVQLTSQVSSPLGITKSLISKIRLNGIDVKQLFVECNNFNQQEFTSKNINGKLTGNIDLSLAWNEKGVLDKNTMMVLAELKFAQGGIQDFEPLYKLSKFSNLADLKNLKFADITNTILIKDQTFTIPEMEIRSNAMNLTISGKQTFAGEVDYKFKIKLSELLRSKRTATENEFEEVDESGKGVYLFLTMRGTVDKPEFSYDKLAVKQKVKQDLKQEKETIKALFKKEFSNEQPIKEKNNNSDELEFEQE